MTYNDEAAYDEAETLGFQPEHRLQSSSYLARLWI